MPTIALEIPKTRPAGILTTPSGSTIRVGTAGNYFYIKVRRSRWSNRVRVQETTGDGDSAVEMESNQYLTSRFVLLGLMIANQKVGLANLTDSAKNPLPTLSEMQFNYGSKVRWTVATALFETIDTDYDAVSNSTGVIMTGWATTTAVVESLIT